MLRYRIIAIKVDPEVEGFNTLNRRIQENRRYAEEQVAEQQRINAARKRFHAQERKHRAWMGRLVDKILWCVLATLGVFVCWLLGLVSLTFFWITCFVCLGISAFLAGVGWERDHSRIKGDHKTRRNPIEDYTTQ